MKNWILIILSLTLTVSSFTLFSNNVKPDIVAGAGNEEDYRVTSIEKLDSVLDFLSYAQGGGVYEDEVGLVSYVDNPTMVSDYDYEHTSATYQEYGYITSHVRHVYMDYQWNPDTLEYDEIEQYLGSTDTSLTRNMTVYVTEDASYYISKGTYSVNDSKDSYKTTIIFDVKIYIDIEKVLFKFDTFEISSNDDNDLAVDDKLLGRWIQIPIDSSGDVFSMIDVGNRDAFSYIGEIIKEASEDDIAEKNGNIYTIGHTVMRKNDTELKIDLSNSANPCMTMIVDSKPEENQLGNQLGNQLYMYVTSTFKNVDNTVINVNVSDALIFETEEDFEDYMEG